MAFLVYIFGKAVSVLPSSYFQSWHISNKNTTIGDFRERKERE